MKAVRKLLILAMACALFCAQGIAVSETAPTVPPLRHILDISLAVSPDELISSGEVSLAFTITNDSQFVAGNIYLESADGHHSESLGQLLPGETQVYSRTYAVSEAELDAGKLSFIISHDDIISSGGEDVTYTVAAQVTRTEPEADAEFTRQISSRQVSADTVVMITYRVKNTGNVPLVNVKVQDELGSFTGHAETLNPGETKIFTNRISITKGVSSAAKVSFGAPSVSEEIYQISLDDAEISVVESSVSVGLTLDRQSAAYGDVVNGVVTIAAEGAGLTDVTVFDDVNNTIIADTISVNAGETATITCSWPVRGIADYRVRIEGINTAGEYVTEYSGTTALKLDGEFAHSDLSITANVQTPKIKRKGSARISVAIVNSGNTTARDVVLSEAALGELHRFEFVPAGDPTVTSLLVEVDDDTEYVFSITYTAADGSTVICESEPVSIVIAADGEEPVQNDGDKSAEVYEIRSEGFYYWMIGAGGFILLVLIILLIVSHDRERRERKLRQQMLGKQRRKEHSRSIKNPK